MPETSAPTAWSVFVNTLKHVEKSKINRIWLAVRNAMAVAAPLSIGSLIGNALGAVAISTGALNVSYSDGSDPYLHRAKRMLTWSLVGGFAVFVGSATGKYHLAAIEVTAVWAFVGGMFVAVSQRAADLGLNTLVTVIVFAARGALSPLYAFYAALLVVAGGLLQTALSLLFWPFRKYEPQRRAIAAVYFALADEIDPAPGTPPPSPLNNPTQQVQDALAALSDDSTEDARFRILFDQADRIRISVFLLDRLRPELAKGGGGSTNETVAVACIDDLRFETAQLVRSVARCLQTGSSLESGEMEKVEETAQGNRMRCGRNEAVGDELTSAINALVGQLRSIVRLTGTITPEGREETERRESGQPWRLRAASWIGAMRANLDWRSPVLRHAVRLSVCVAMGDTIGRSISWQRSYWIPMTIAVVLKPDFSSTFSRGVLRLLGTFVGLVIATALYNVFPAGPLLDCLLTFVFTFTLRWVGPANYGVFSVAISGLIVFELAAAGTPPEQVVLTRALCTAAGGILALVAYALWPTWERRKVADLFADMIDAAREYFHAVVQGFTSDDPATKTAIDRARREFRRTRAEAAASTDRVVAEPGTSFQRVNALKSAMANSLALFSSILGLEAGLDKAHMHTAPEIFQQFAHDVEFTLYYLGAALRTSKLQKELMPKLRDDHARMLESRDQFSSNDQFVLLETDRLTTALNTMREQIERYLPTP